MKLLVVIVVATRAGHESQLGIGSWSLDKIVDFQLLHLVVGSEYFAGVGSLINRQCFLIFGSSVVVEQLMFDGRLSMNKK